MKPRTLTCRAILTALLVALMLSGSVASTAAGPITLGTARQLSVTGQAGWPDDPVTCSLQHTLG